MWRGLWRHAELLAGTAGEAYMEARGIPGFAIRKRVRFHPQFYGHPSVLFPILDRNGKMVGCQGRSIEGKYISAGGGSQAGVFGTLREPLIICESPIDALTLEVCGYRSIAVFGTVLPVWLQWSGLVYLASDADEKGDGAAEHWQVTFPSAVRLRPERKDWNDWYLSEPFDLAHFLREMIRR